jgi:hypothetical protein
LAFGAAAGAGAWACVSEARKEVASAVAANKAKTRPRGQNGAAKIRKFIAETLSERESPKSLQASVPSRLGGCLLAN